MKRGLKILFLVGSITLAMSSCSMNDDELVIPEIHNTEIDDPVEADRDDNQVYSKEDGKPLQGRGLLFYSKFK